MTDNVIWGTNFKAGKEPTPIEQFSNYSDYTPVTVRSGSLSTDTAPSEYSAPDGDCA